MSQPYYIAQWDRRWIVGVLCCCLLLTFQPALYCCCLYQTSPTGPLLMSVCSRHAHASPNTDTHTCTRTVVDAFLHRAVFVCIKGKKLSWRAKLIFFLFLGSKQYKIYKINSPLTLCIEPHGGQSDMPHAKSTNQNIMSPYIELLGQLSCKNTKKYIDKNKKNTEMQTSTATLCPLWFIHKCSSMEARSGYAWVTGLMVRCSDTAAVRAPYWAHQHHLSCMTAPSMWVLWWQWGNCPWSSSQFHLRVQQKGWS